MPQKMERYMRLKPEMVLPFIVSDTKSETRPEFYGVPCHTTGLRLMTFKTKGLKCITCGIEGSTFVIERNVDNERVNRDAFSSEPYHINLYGYNEFGAEILLTHDHILARGLGGKDVLENTQTMCSPCNSRKGREEQLALLAMQKGETPATKEFIEKIGQKKLNKIKVLSDEAKRRKVELLNYEQRIVRAILNGKTLKTTTQELVARGEKGSFTKNGWLIIYNYLVVDRGFTSVVVYGSKKAQQTGKAASKEGSAVCLPQVA